MREFVLSGQDRILALLGFSWSKVRPLIFNCFSKDYSSAKRTKPNCVCLIFLVSGPENTSIIASLKERLVTTINRTVKHKSGLLV